VIRRWFLATVLVLATGTACSPAVTPNAEGSQQASQPATNDGGSTVRLQSDSGVDLTFDVESCTSPGSNVINLQASDGSNDLDLRASVEGSATVSGATSLDGRIESIEIDEDGTVTASGQIVPADGGDNDPFTITGHCPNEL
jgi:hypothetical protein